MLYKLSRTYLYSILILILVAAANAIALQLYAITVGLTGTAPNGNALFPACFLPAALALALAEDRKVKEIGNAPWWLRAIAMTSGIYGVAVILVTTVFNTGEFSAFDEMVGISAVSLAMNVIGLCIVQPVLLGGQLSRAETIKRARNSALAGVLIVVFFLLPHR